MDSDIAKIENEARLVRFLQLKKSGESDDDIRAKFEMDLETYDAFVKECFLHEVERIQNKSVGEVYVEYMLAQKKCIADLEKMATKFDQAKHYSALVNSVKTRSDILDKIIKVGQDFGLLEKRPERKEIVAGVLITKMDDDQLRNTILGELKNLEKMMNHFGDHTIIDLPQGSMYRELPAPLEMKEPESLEGHKTRSHVISGGRKVVKKKKP
jgi:hypothetical protein